MTWVSFAPYDGGQAPAPDRREDEVERDMAAAMPEAGSDAARTRSAGSQPEPLTEVESGVLDVERRWWRYSGVKETAIRERLGMSGTRYYQILNQLLDSEAALAHDPMLIKRLRRLRSERHRERSVRRLHLP